MSEWSGRSTEEMRPRRERVRVALTIGLEAAHG